jgi:hypothetical protein
MVIWGFEIGELLAAALRYRYLNFRLFCMKIILKSPQKSKLPIVTLGGAECGFNHIEFSLSFGLLRKLYFLTPPSF